MTEVRFGTLLPHFGSLASRDSLVEGSVEIERLGFDSVWARDHVVFEPHAYEDQDRTHLDPLVVLSMVGAVTSRLMLGTATLIPHRHPLAAATALASLDFLTGGGRVILGLGIGNDEREFAALGMGGYKRAALTREQVQIMRAVWSGEPVSHDGAFYSFSDVTICPPVPHLPIWAGGTGPLSVRRAVNYGDGWLASRIPRRDYVQRVAMMRELSEQTGRDCPTPAIIMLVSPAATVEEGMARLQLDQLAAAMRRNKFTEPASGGFQTPDDFDGVFAAGPPEAIVEQAQRWIDAGAQHIVFDLRAVFDDFAAQLAMLSAEVLPRLRGRG